MKKTINYELLENENKEYYIKAKKLEPEDRFFVFYYSTFLLMKTIQDAMISGKLSEQTLYDLSITYEVMFKLTEIANKLIFNTNSNIDDLLNGLNIDRQE